MILWALIKDVVRLVVMLELSSIGGHEIFDNAGDGWLVVI